MPAGSSKIYQDDARLVARAVGGDHGAFRQLFEAYAPLIYRLVFRMIGNQDDAADLTQDIFVRAYQRLGSLREQIAFQAWITRLAINMVHDAMRRRKPYAFSLDATPSGSDDGGEWHIPDESQEVDASLLSTELTAHIQAALLTLSEEHRTVVILHHLEHKSVEDISILLSVPIGTVKSRLVRGRAELRKRLDAYVRM